MIKSGGITMDSISVNNEMNGDIRISDEVIATIASVATKEVEGISGLSLSIADEIASKFVKKNSNRAIRVVANDKELTIDISILVKYGIRIPDVSWEVQENVKKSVESMTGLTVGKVNVIISGVNFEENDSADKNTSEEE